MSTCTAVPRGRGAVEQGDWLGLRAGASAWSLRGCMGRERGRAPRAERLTH